ncbi:MAG: hypothetical protein FJX25_10235 [Alphaproteobacteria bacterium]|nr:hypothetical protein [Alphaproteobacteria bacterium]
MHDPNAHLSFDERMDLKYRVPREPVQRSYLMPVFMGCVAGGLMVYGAVAHAIFAAQDPYVCEMYRSECVAAAEVAR